MNPRDMQKIMKQMKTEEIDAEEVLVRLKNGKEMVVENPSVVKMSIMGQETLQVSGRLVEKVGVFSDEDVGMVAEQAGVSKEDARKALEESGDIAAAILRLKG